MCLWTPSSCCHAFFFSFSLPPSVHPSPPSPSSLPCLSPCLSPSLSTFLPQLPLVVVWSAKYARQMSTTSVSTTFLTALCLVKHLITVNDYYMQHDFKMCKFNKSQQISECNTTCGYWIMCKLHWHCRVHALYFNGCCWLKHWTANQKVLVPLGAKIYFSSWRT